MPLLVNHIQRDQVPKEDPDTALYYGTCTGGTSQKGYLIKFDILPLGEDVVNVRKVNLRLIHPGEEEPRLDAKFVAAIEAEMKEERDKNKSPETLSEERFVSQDQETISTATTFSCTYHEGKDPVVWEILADGVHIEHCTEYDKLKDHSRPRVEGFNFDEDIPLHENFLSMFGWT